MLPLTPDHDFHTQLAQARLEALAVLRRAMTDQDNPPSKEAIRAAAAILRLPKHLSHPDDQPPPRAARSREHPTPPQSTKAPSTTDNAPGATTTAAAESPFSSHPTLSITPTLNLINRLLTAPLDTPEDKLLRLLSDLPTSPPRTESS